MDPHNLGISLDTSLFSPPAEPAPSGTPGSPEDRPLTDIVTGTPPAPPTPIPSPNPPAEDLGKKLEDERIRVAQLSAQLQSVVPLLELIEKDEEISALIDARSRGTTSTMRGENKPPVAPEMPAGYNETDALTNPQSASWKYRKEMEAYYDKKLSYLESTIQARTEEEKKRKQADEDRARYQTYLTDVAKYVQRQHGLNPVEAQSFIETMTAPETFKVDNLVRYYRFLKTGAAPPTPPTIPSGGGAPPVNGKQTADDAFSDNLISIAKKRTW